MKWDRTKGRPEPIRALNRIRELENNEPLVDLREVAPAARIARDTVIPFVRRRVAEMVQEAAVSLPEGIYLGIVDAWRPFVRQVRIYEWMMGNVEVAFPDMPYAQRRRKVCRWVAPVDQKAPPGHCTGAAVDILLLDEQNEPLDLTAPFERFAASPTWTLGLTEEAARNRFMMVDAMLNVGFSNCRDEYWHYSWGDAGWAVRMGETECVYGLVELPEEIWAVKQAEWEEVLVSRPNPFLPASPEA